MAANLAYGLPGDDSRNNPFLPYKLLYTSSDIQFILNSFNIAIDYNLSPIFNCYTESTTKYCKY